MHYVLLQNLWKAASEKYKMSKKSVGDNTMEEHKLLSSFLDSNMGKHQLKTVCIHIIAPQLIHKKTWRKFINKN
jgi:hypothetical protein